MSGQGIDFTSEEIEEELEEVEEDLPPTLKTPPVKQFAVGASVSHPIHGNGIVDDIIFHNNTRNNIAHVKFDVGNSSYFFFGSLTLLS